jgi:molybdopterin synthase sulfur carrier subunit
MSLVRVPPVLRGTIGAREVEAYGTTVGEVLNDLINRYPAVREQLFDESGQLQRFVNVYVNEQDIQYLDRLDTPVRPEDTVIILPAMAGG